MKKLFTLILLFVLLLGTKTVQSQTDTEFWFAVPKVTQGHGWNNRKFYFRFANLNLANTITISMPSDPTFVPIVNTLAPNEARTVNVTNIIFDLWTENPNEIYNRGIKITATNLTTAYFEVGTNNNPDIYALKGKNALGNDFFVPFQNRFNNGNYNPKPYSAIYIVATQDVTTITVTPTGNVFPGRPAGIPFDTILNMGQTIAIAPDNYAGAGQLAANHLGGTRVQSDKPIAISTSDDSVAANPYGGCRDLIGDQIIPTNIIGTEYIAMKGRIGQGGANNMPEFFYVVGTKPNTQVFIDGNLEIILQAGEQFRWQFTQQNHHILTNEPSYVYHVAGFGCEMGGAVLPPINVCTGSTKVSFTRSKGESFFLNILVRAGAEDAFTFNGDGPNTIIKASDFVNIPGTTSWLAAEYQMNQTQVPIAVASLIENHKDVFHLGIINGGPSSGTMYGYFSDFNELDVKANISGAGAMHRACFGDPVQLIAQGGVNYLWSPPDYLDDPTSSTPVAIPDSTIKYTVTVSGACKMVDSVSVYVTLYGPANAAFTIDEPAGCSPFEVAINNESYGINNYSWRMGDGTVYTSGADEILHTYTNTTDEPVVHNLMLVGRYSMCRDTMSTKITVYPEVKAEMEPDIFSGCAPLKVNFSNYSTGALNYMWDFGDGASSGKTAPIHEFQNFSDKDTIFEVTLTAVSKNGCVSEKTIPIQVKPYIETRFDFDPPVSCSPYPVTLNNTSFGATNSLWSFNNGTSFETINDTEFLRTLENNSPVTDTLNIWLIGENNYGCRDTLVRPLILYPEVKAVFDPNILEGCNPLPVEFTNLSDNADSYLWEFDHLQGSSSEQNPVVWFENQSLQDTAVFNVKLTATSKYFCEDVAEQQIRVYPRIEAGFSFDHTSYCTPQEITFHNNSQGADYFNWNFGNGSFSQSGEIELAHVFENSTAMDMVLPVQLIIENESGCKDTLTRDVIIYPEVKADFEMITSGCHPLEVNFENLSSGASDYLWHFGDGGNSQNEAASRIYTNTSHSQEKIYQVMLEAKSQFGCKDTLYQEITVFPKPKASYIISESYGCAPITVDFTTSSEGASNLFWNFGDTNNQVETTGNISHLYNNNSSASNLYTSELIAVNDFGCQDTTYRTIEIYPEINASFEISEISGCHPLNLEIINSSTGASAETPYLWNYGDGNTSTHQTAVQEYVFTNSGHIDYQHYTLKLKATSQYGCKDSTETTVIVFPKPEARFEPEITEGCSPLTIDYEDMSTGAAVYQWNFGDGYASELNGSVSHIFNRAYNAGPGVFSTQLLIVNEFGCKDTTVRQITVYPDISADFDAVLEGCHPHEVDFNNLSLGVNTLNWTFGDGSTSGGENPKYTFTNESYTEQKHYNVNLHTESVFGCQADVSKVITVYPKPQSAFSTNLDEGCAPLPVQITNQSVGGSQYQWEFAGTSSTENQQVFEHIFHNQQETIQTYQLKLRTTNQHGCFRESTQELDVFPEVIADFSADNSLMSGCSPLPLQFENLSERAQQYRWDFNDGNSSIVNEPANTFFTPASHESIFNIKLKAQSIYGCVDSVIHKARVYPAPIADMTVSPHQQTYPSTNVRAENFTLQGNWSFEWYMGDGTTIITDNWDTLEHEYVWPVGDYATKEYTINLKVSNSYCSDSISQKIRINAPHPLVGFEPAAEGCPPLEVQFRNDSEYGLQFFWDFNDGSSSDLENPMHIFEDPGEYMVKLLVSGEGGLDSAYQKVTVFENPTAAFRVAHPLVQLPYEEARMVNLSSLASYYEWHMGDGTIYYDFEPEHLYNEPGTYDIRLNVATNTFPQCYDSSVKAAAVVAEQGCQIIFPDAFMPNSSGPNGGSYIVNDPANYIFYPIHTGLADYKLEIYNRWGELLFRSEDVDIGWDGYYRGKLSPMDVYVWKVWGTCHGGKKIKAAGDVTLYR